MKDNDPLHEKLQAWKVKPAIPGTFHANVWAGIRRRKTLQPDTGWAAFLRWLFPTPAVWQLATATALVMLTLGAALGTLQADSTVEQDRAELAQRYVQSVDPYLQMAADRHPAR